MGAVDVKCVLTVHTTSETSSLQIPQDKRHLARSVTTQRRRSTTRGIWWTRRRRTGVKCARFQMWSTLTRENVPSVRQDRSITQKVRVPATILPILHELLLLKSL